MAPQVTRNPRVWTLFALGLVLLVAAFATGARWLIVPMVALVLVTQWLKSKDEPASR